MKIAFYGQPLLSDSKTGIAYCEQGLVQGLLKKYPQNRYYADIFTFGQDEKKAALQSLGNPIRTNECRWISERFFKMISLVIEIPYHLLFPKERDITHFFNYVVPFGVKGKKVVTVHDLAFREYPETVRGRTMLMLKRHLKQSIRRADAVIAVSEFTKQEILKYYDIPEEAVYVVPNGIDITQYHTGYGDEEIGQIKKKYGIGKEYFLYLGTIEPRKNLSGLIRAYRIFYDRVRKNGRDVPQLVLAGGKGWMYDDTFRTAEELFSGNEILFTGYVDDEEKAPLMNGASIFCFPSFYEGFGMPPIEAMACGTPVLTSDSSSLAEVTGDAALQTDPCDIVAMAEEMLRLYQSEELRQQLISRGLEQAKKYSWESAVEKLWQVYDMIQK